jgi:hypothetical protein
MHCITTLDKLIPVEIPLDELGQIEENYKRGSYSHLSDCLRQFLVNHSSRILEFRTRYEQKQGTPFMLETAVALYIFDNKTVDMKLDMKDQRNEILREIWIRHEKNNRETDSEIERDWVRKYAEGWRTHRTREIMYLFSRNKENYLELIK